MQIINNSSWNLYYKEDIISSSEELKYNCIISLFLRLVNVNKLKDFTEDYTLHIIITLKMYYDCQVCNSVVWNPNNIHLWSFTHKH